ncbi:MAG: hypothetical protein CSYNP_03456 [Syntrophus sp. SKADARSKE-3]|nr:hypothetical protein [Syntrophus sp. SKADARSKE-3]
MFGKKFLSAISVIASIAVLMVWAPWGYTADRTIQLTVPACDS